MHSPGERYSPVTVRQRSWFLRRDKVECNNNNRTDPARPHLDVLQVLSPGLDDQMLSVDMDVNSGLGLVKVFFFKHVIKVTFYDSAHSFCKTYDVDRQLD